MTALEQEVRRRDEAAAGLSAQLEVRIHSFWCWEKTLQQPPSVAVLSLLQPIGGQACMSGRTFKKLHHVAHVTGGRRMCAWKPDVAFATHASKTRATTANSQVHHIFPI